MSAGADGRWRRAVLPAILAGVFCAFSAGSSPLAGQEGLSRVELRARTMARIYDNFFRATDGAPDEMFLGWATDGRVTLRIDRSSGIEVYGEAEYVRYERLSDETEFTRVERLGESYGLGAGLRLGRNPEVLRLRASYQQDRPVFNVGDEVRTANILRGSGDYTYRIGEDWEVGIDGQAVSVTFDAIPENENRIFAVGGSVRYRGIGYQLQPELGGQFGWRGTDEENQQYRQGHFYARLVSVPVDALWMSVRYRIRTRAYPHAEPLSANFERSDRGGQWTVASSYRASPNLHLDVHYDRLDMESTLPRRNFAARVLTVGLTVFVGT